MGQASGLSSRTLGERGGVEAVALQVDQLPAHSHMALADGSVGNQSEPYQATWAPSLLGQFSSNSGNTPMNPAAIAASGDGFAHENMPPFLPISFIIALAGIYPSPNDEPLEAYLGEIRSFGF